MNSQIPPYSGENQAEKGSPIGLLIGASLLAVFLWFIPIGRELTLPIRYFVTYLHELGHALAAYATGGFAGQMGIFPNGEGVTQVYGGWPLITFSAGYLGSTIFGAILLLIGRRPQWARRAFYALVGVILLTMIFWVRNSFGIFIGFVLAALLFLAGRYLKGRTAVFLLQFLAVQCCLSSLWDVETLVRLNAAGVGDNDAAFLAQQTGIPGIVWGILWALGSLAIVALSVMVLWGIRLPLRRSKQRIA